MRPSVCILCSMNKATQQSNVEDTGSYRGCDKQRWLALAVALKAETLYRVPYRVPSITARHPPCPPRHHIHITAEDHVQQVRSRHSSDVLTTEPARVTFEMSEGRRGNSVFANSHAILTLALLTHVVVTTSASMYTTAYQNICPRRVGRSIREKVDGRSRNFLWPAYSP